MIALRRAAVVALIAASGVLVAAKPVSDWTGVYALIDRVVMEPDTVNPRRIQLWGVFALARVTEFDLNSYWPAQRGYLYYSIEGGTADGIASVVAEWRDLQLAAGTGEPVAFGNRFPTIVAVRAPTTAGMPDSGAPVWVPVRGVRRAGEKPANPSPYPRGIGVTRLPQTGGGLIREVQYVPAPISPADGGEAKPGRVQLVTRNVGDPTAEYVFEIEDARGQAEMSVPIPAGKGQTSWSPKLELRDGEEYTWRVKTVWGGGWVFQPAVSTFRARK